MFIKMIQEVAYCVAIVILGSLALTADAEDEVAIANKGPGEVGLLVDGQGATGHVNDRTRTSAVSPIGVGNLDLSGMTNEAVGFSNRKPPKYSSAAWTGADDNVNLSFQDEIQNWFRQRPLEHLLGRC